VPRLRSYAEVKGLILRWSDIELPRVRGCLSHALKRPIRANFALEKAAEVQIEKILGLHCRPCSFKAILNSQFPQSLFSEHVQKR
jgi:hypothetical protein